MEYFGDTSLSAKLYWIATMIYYFTIVVIGLFTLLYFLNFHHFPNNGNLHLKVKFGGLSFISESGFSIPFPNFIAIVVNSVIYLVMIQGIRQILWNFKNNEIFIINNFTRIRLIGVLIFATGIGSSVLNLLNWNLIHENIHISGYTAEMSLVPDFSKLAMGGAIMFFAHLFILAVKIYEENELTI